MLIKPSALGDVVQTIGVSRLLNAHFPDRPLHWLVNESFAGLVRPLPWLDRVVTFPRHGIREFRDVPRGVDKLRRMVRELRDQNYELCLDLQGLLRSGLMTFSSGAVRKVGVSDAREGAAWFYNEVLPAQPRPIHAIDRYLAALQGIGVSVPAKPDMRLGVSEAESASLRDRWPELAGKYTLLVPGSRWMSKRWPPEHFASLLRWLAKRSSDPIVLAGDPSEAPLCASIIEQASVSAVNLAGSTSLRELAALIAGAALVVCNDSAAMHMAALEGRPLVALFGPTNPAYTGPWRRPECVVRSEQAGGEHRQYRHSDDSLMRLISVSEVQKRVEQLDSP